MLIRQIFYVIIPLASVSFTVLSLANQPEGGVSWPLRKEEMAKTTEIRLSKMLSEERVVDLISSKKDSVIKELTQVMSTSKAVGHKINFYKAIVEREKIVSTGIGMGIAIPHAKEESVSDFVLAIGRRPEGLDFESLDGQPAQLVFMLAAPNKQNDEFLRVLSKIVLVLKNQKFRKKILEARSTTEVVQLFKDK